MVTVSISGTEPSSNIENITLYLKSLLKWSDVWTINFMITINLLPTPKDDLADSLNNSNKIQNKRVNIILTINLVKVNHSWLALSAVVKVTSKDSFVQKLKSQ